MTAMEDISFEKVAAIPSRKGNRENGGKWISRIREMATGDVVRIEGDNAIRNTIYNCARAAGLRVRTSIVDGYVYIERLS